MDKETLSNYGWIVICTLVLAVMIALASPFGEYISGAVKSTTQGLFDVSKNALSSAGIDIAGLSFSDDDEEFEEGMEGEDINNSLAAKTPVKFGQKYIVTKHSDNEHVGAEYIFYEDGSAYCCTTFGGADEVPAGYFTYTSTEIIPDEGSAVQIIENGTKLDFNDGEMILILESEMTGLRFGQEYLVSVDNMNDGEILGQSYVFYEDGSAVYWLVGGDVGDSEDEGYFTYTETQIQFADSDGLVFAEILENGTKLNIFNGSVEMVLKSSIPEPKAPIKFGEKYISLEAESYIIFYKDGSCILGSTTGTDYDEFPAFTFTYTETTAVSETLEFNVQILENGKKVDFGDDFILTLESEIEYLIKFGERYVLSYESDGETKMSYYTFYKDGGCLVEDNGEINESEAGSCVYTTTDIYLVVKSNGVPVRTVLFATAIEDGTKLSINGSDAVLVLESAM